nr:putative type I non-reducing polyketide synthase [Cladonia rangiferina]
MALPSLIAFGALAPWPAPDRLHQLRNALQHQKSLNPIMKAIQELPLLWKALSKQDPSLHSIAGEAAADQLAQWMTGAGTTQIVDDKGNVTRMPLTTVAQITQYISYLRQYDEPLRHESLTKSAAVGGGIQGFCIGLLSALAVASGKTEDDVGNFAAISVRLAFCIGAYVDLDQHRNSGDSKASTLAVRWKAPTTLEDIQRLLSKHPGTYIAVVRDVRDVTITVPASVMERLIEDLSQIGASLRDTGVSGRYHVAIHEGIPRKILETCQAPFSPTLDGHSLVRSNTDAHLFSDEDTALLALECILGERADWYSTISTAASALNQISTSPYILSIGTDAVPQSVARSFPVVKATMIADRVNGAVEPETPVLPLDSVASVAQGYPLDAIAIIGMGCRFPGADSIDEFWNLLTDGKSMLSEIPEARFGRGRPARSPSTLRFWGNFLRDIEAFDHGFFKKSPREAVSMDPQQRILLQVAYEALESSGYFADSSRPEDIGCYIGACATDYDFNVASHPPSAYSATGTLRSFLSGKLSHYFGWSGPSLVLDTACSSSAVAIHTACTALMTGQCSQALAGGITLMTSPYLFENFAAAHFLSPTGSSKPFSADADGYGRGEGGGLVVLKRLSDALRDDDHILGVIAGSAVNQNDNCVPITVPHTSSQGDLYERVTEQAGVRPSKVTFVEAHGTGTPVGDPIEMESIRRVFGGLNRGAPLIVSSAKGNIGHLEGASGVAALIKALLQIEYRLAPQQASFKTLNPKIPALEPDNLCIPTSNLVLSGERLAACINNYGAAGSNAAMVVFEPPRKGFTHHGKPKMGISSRPNMYPIQLAAASVGSLLAYCVALDQYCQQLRCTQDTSEQSQILSNLAFSLSTRLNQELSFRLTMTATDLDQLQSQLRQQTITSTSIKQHSKAPPIVLCFGGQVSDRIALDKCLWQESTLLRSYLDMCDNTLRVMGYPGLYPSIFQTEAVTDVVLLHSMVFATQYSCAQAWLESGLKVDALVGHSFGQLTALCVSGMLSLRDALKLVAGRAFLMQKHWGPESGKMIAVETDQQTLEELQKAICVSNASHSFEIACFNGPTSHVVVSDRVSTRELEKKLIERAIRHRNLDVPYGFHSRFTEPLLPHLEDLASSLAFYEPQIPLETCTDTGTWTEPTAKLIAAHTREPVFFGKAIQRLQARLGPCTWLEAGSDSSIVNMVRRALGQSSATANNFVSLQLNKPNSTKAVVDATVALWGASHRVRFWNFHRLQRSQYEHLRLPPYAWDNSKHWLELEMSAALNSNKIDISPPTNTAGQVELPSVLIRLKSVDSRGHHFVINPSSKEYQTIVKDLESLGSAVCPPTLYVELASRAVRIADRDKGNGLLSIQEFEVHSLLGLNVHQTISLDLQRLTQSWRFRVTSANGSTNGSKAGEAFCHAEGIVGLKVADPSLEEEFCRYERLTGHNKINCIAEDPRSESLRGNVIYKMLARAVNYPDWCRGVKSVAAVDLRVVARVTSPASIPEIVSKETTTQLPILESFIQVCSLHANCLHERRGDEVFQFTRADHMQWAPDFDFLGDGDSAEASWDVLAYTSKKAGTFAYDIFIHDTATGRLVVLILGAHFTDIRRQGTILAGLSTTLAPEKDTPNLKNVNAERIEIGLISNPPAVSHSQANLSRPGKDAKTSIYDDICGLLEKLADIPVDQVSGDASFDNLGVDSLMMIEVISELSTLFRVDLPIHELEELTDINSLVNYLHGKGCVGSLYVEDSDNTSSLSSSQAIFTGASSPPDSSGGSAMTTPPEALSLDHADSIATKQEPRAAPAMSNGTGRQPLDLGPYGIQQIFTRVRLGFDKYAEQTGAKGFWTNVYPQQADLVCSYVVDAYRKLGCDLASLAAGQQLPSINTLPRHKHLVAQLRNILVESGLLELRGNEAHVRTTKKIDSTPTAIRYEQMLQRHPLDASETKLLNVTGPRLADCLTGQKEPLSLLFGDKHNRDLLADFYANSQMLKAATRLLAEFVSSTISAGQSGGTLCILEVGAGTGGTTRYLVDVLNRCGMPYEYTFTDISQSLVTQAKRNFSNFPQMKFMTFDCDRPAPQELLGRFHIVISTNCIHATSNITTSTANILPTLREDGALCLVEFTRNLYWFDLVFGLLEGWWLFSDGRQHALANEWFWDRSIRAAGFKHVSWTDGNTEEAKTLRLICAFRGEANQDPDMAEANRSITKRAGVPMEEVVWKRVGTLDLSADIYFPKTPDPPGKKRPIALLIHGGGHFLFGRKDVPMKHIRTLIERGFLPISTDYRLCPETNLFEGPMRDCCDALKWATETLPTLPLSGPTVRPNPTKVVSLGWSSGGQLAMSLGYTAPARGIKAPDAIFALYPPSDMESNHWHQPCYPLAAEEKPTEIVDILAGVRESPIVEYAPVSEKRTMALSLTLKDDRASIILHMCWKSQTVPILVHGLPNKKSLPATDKTDWKYRPPASVEQVQAISPLWQIRNGNYKTPTFIVHGNGDDWLPLSMSERTIEELKRRGISASIAVPEQCGHAFDLFPVGDPLGVGWTALEQGYDFICRQLGMN